MSENHVLLEYYDQRSAVIRGLLASLFGESEIDAVAVEVRREFEALLPEAPYADQPYHTMFESSFGTLQLLAAYNAARKRGCDVHEFGRAALTAIPTEHAAPVPMEALAKLREDAAVSQESGAPNEFVFEIVEGDAAGDADFGLNILSCAVCHAYSKHDAMDLVPYMCASDDVVSDAGGQGLRRTGTIGLGADRCDFRFKAGGNPLRLVEQYPDRIKSD
jgi:hypothetical protein